MLQLEKIYNKINENLIFSQDNKEVADIYIIGDIVDEKFWENEVSLSSIMSEIKEFDYIKTLNLHMTSNGGSVTAGNSIINYLKNYKEKNNVQIVGYVSCAMSMCSGISTVCDYVYMYENGIMMLHKPLTMVTGNANDLRKTADTLDIFEQTLLANYKNKFNGTEEELIEIMENETYLTANDCLKWGFANEIIESMEIVAKVDTISINGVEFNNKDIINLYKENKPVKNTKGGFKMKYNDILNESYGISEESFKTIDDVGNLLSIVLANHSVDKENYIEKSLIVNALEKTEATQDEVINFIKESVANKKNDTINLINEGKAKQYDLIKSEKIAETLENGIRALGIENFDEETWKKTLKNMDYKYICNLSNSFDKQAINNTKAGKKSSATAERIGNDRIFTDKDKI